MALIILTAPAVEIAAETTEEAAKEEKTAE